MDKRIDTFKSRKVIGFLRHMSDWNKKPAVYDDHTLKINGHPVMEDWETPYMKKLSDVVTFKGGRILEIGYGMGISTRFIQQSSKVKQHVIIECHPDVILKLVNDFKTEIQHGKIHVLSGFWQSVVPFFADEYFDGILFDTYPLREEEIHSNHFWFFEEAYRLLKKGGVLTYYSDEATKFSSIHMHRLQYAGFNEINLDLVKVNPPPDCQYWQYNTIIAPIVIK